VTGRDATVVGLLAPPGLPARIAEELAAKQLPRRLAERLDGDRTWDVRFHEEARAHDAKDDDDLIDVAREAKEREGWDFALSLTDLPFGVDGRPVVADAIADDRLGIVSLPALGAIRRRQRAVNVMARLTAFLVGERDVRDGFASPIEVDDPGVDLRLATSRGAGHLTLLMGMLRSNRPWRVVLGLSRALVVALSTAAFAMITSTVWQLGEALGTPRQVVFSVVVLTAMVVWLMVVHDLWEKPAGGLDRQQARLFNATTVLTLALGAACFYAALFALSLVTAGFILDAAVLESSVGHPVGFVDYVAVAWFTTSLATLGGTLGSGLEDRLEVREAAYSYHPERVS
jgi:hypothetical protein